MNGECNNNVEAQFSSTTEFNEILIKTEEIITKIIDSTIIVIRPVPVGGQSVTFGSAVVETVNYCSPHGHRYEAECIYTYRER